MEMIVACVIKDMETGREDHGISKFHTRTEFNAFSKECIDRMIEVPGIQITFKLLYIKDGK